jgi:hypothetical protein
MDTPLPGYPQPFGSRYLNITTHQGPLSYQAGGETVNASTFGFGSFDTVRAGMSFNANNTGNYTVRVLIPKAQSPVVSNNNQQVPIPTGSNNVNLQWIVTATGNEAANNTNLTSEFVRCEYFGG